MVPYIEIQLISFQLRDVFIQENVIQFNIYWVITILGLRKDE